MVRLSILSFFKPRTISDYNAIVAHKDDKMTKYHVKLC